MRQICLLREQGDTAGALRLQENDLATVVEEIRRTPGTDALRDEDLAALFAQEAQRVAEATLTAEIMIHRLAEIWSSPPAAAPQRREATAARETVTARPVPAGPPVISDLLDAMLALERTSTRPTPNR